jgi:hypothetical protein
MIMLAATLALVGCNSEPDEIYWASAPNDPQVREYVFNRCLNATSGPQSTKYNDWDEAIEACESAASMVSYYCPPGARCKEHVPSRADVRAILPKEAAR